MRESLFNSAIAGSGVINHPRFPIYRNNVAAGLVTALRVRFPVTEVLLGPDAFARAAADYARGNRPRSAVLISYGATFPDHIVDPAIADVGRLENLWWRAYHAAEAEPLPPAAFANLTPDEIETARFVFHLSASIFASPYAVGTMWDTRQAAAPTPQAVLVARPEAEVNVTLLDTGMARFLASLMAGAALPEALGDGDPAMFRTLIELQIVTQIRKEQTP